MLFLFSDFGLQGPYAGEMEAAARRHSQQTPIHLMHDAPSFEPGAAGLLLRALSRQFQPGDICVAVVDPGVGGARCPVCLLADGIYYVGPDNGLLAPLADHASRHEWWEITWRPEQLSASFHGRDLFAPFAAQLQTGMSPTAIGAQPLHDPVSTDSVSDQIIYVDGFGNCVTGLLADDVPRSSQLMVNGKAITRARSFCDVPPGQSFWYRNSMDLVEIAANQDSAAALLELTVGTSVSVDRG
ncbi:SAM-dependent chlorinase/fluorinase [Gammaproteobacteria bacterium AB-CW1]|uniref:SAM-dependent chlorinase/fluorinase n=1 Tax=Natronospira elongata TaxID=3110268 RepID=A0AAP6MJY8_9GAMM|nr:SAM-dependent chlorinase/fluorinase [Gammaproteobacteria bacterium AB-CW1]